MNFQTTVATSGHNFLEITWKWLNYLNENK